MKYLILFVSLLTFSSCVTKKKCSKRYPAKVEIIYKDSLVFKDSLIQVLKRDTLVQTIKLECDSNNNVVIRDFKSKGQKTIKSNVTLKDNILTTQCIIDSMSVSIKWNEHHIIDKKKEVETIEVIKPLTRWQNFIIVLGYFSLIVIVLYITFRLWLRIK